VRTHFEHVRSAFTVELRDTAALHLARELVLEVLSDVPSVLADPAPSTVLLEPKGQTLVLECRFWSAASRSSVVAARDHAIEGVLRAFDDRGLDAPLDEIVVHAPECGDR
jgi:small-conductance mechanosensitive channel